MTKGEQIRVGGKPVWRSVTWQIIKHGTVKPVPEKVKKPTVPEKTKL